MRSIIVTCMSTALLGLAAQARGADPWVVYDGFKGPGNGKHIVLISGDEEYRSEETIPQLARILAKHHGFKCTVLFAIDRKDGTINPMQNDNIPGLEALVLFFAARRRGDEGPGAATPSSDAHQGLHPAAPPFNLHVADLTRARAEELLDWLEAHGHTGFRISYDAPGGFVVHYP